MTTKYKPSPAITNTAFIASNGEMAWPVDKVADVVEDLRSQGVPILGGELWLPGPNGRWTGLFPGKTPDEPLGVWPINIHSENFHEATREEFINRCAVEFLDAFNKIRPRFSQEIRPDLLSAIRVNIT